MLASGQATSFTGCTLRSKANEADDPALSFGILQHMLCWGARASNM